MSHPPKLDLRRHRLKLEFEEGVLTMEGELADVATKRRALRAAAAVPDVRFVVDRLLITPAGPVRDGEIRAHVRDALVSDSSFDGCRITAAGRPDADPRPRARRNCDLSVTVNGGVVTLEGVVPSLSHRRLAGVVAWWVPGTRDVHNLLLVVPPEEDSDDEISDAVRIALEKDPLIDASHLRARTVAGAVTLYGTVRTDEQRRLAERDAWLVAGVDEVENLVRVVS